MQDSFFRAASRKMLMPKNRMDANWKREVGGKNILNLL
jgi:hypothetical protein